MGYGAQAGGPLLDDLAKRGKGNFTYVSSTDDALAAFGQELGGLLSAYAHDLRIKLSPHQGFRILNVLNDIDVEQHGSDVVVRIPDLYYGETKKVVVEFEGDARSSYLDRPLTVFDVVAQARSGIKELSSQQKAKLKFAKNVSMVSTKPNKEVREAVGIWSIYTAQKKAEEAAAKGDFGQAQFYFNSLDMNGVSDQLTSYLGSVQTGYSSLSSYKSVQNDLSAGMSMLRSARPSTVSNSGLTASLSGIVTTNSLQKSVASSFSGDALQAAMDQVAEAKKFSKEAKP
jgi:hypothetical protein